MRSGDMPSFNPHPSRRTGATGSLKIIGHLTTVSILTRPEGRVQLIAQMREKLEQLFQSSPVPKDGCNR